MKDIFVWLTVLFMTIAVGRYVWQVYFQQISPTLSSWVIFVLGTSLCLITYAIAQEKDLESGILNAVDCIGVSFILIAVILWSKGERRFEAFEKWYLSGIGAIIAYGLITGDAWNSNRFAQALIVIGYFPTIHKLITEKKNKESFSGWGSEFVSATFGLYPAIVGGKELAVLYAIRGIVMIGSLLLLMLYYEVRNKKTT